MCLTGLTYSDSTHNPLSSKSSGITVVDKKSTDIPSLLYIGPLKVSFSLWLKYSVDDELIISFTNTYPLFNVISDDVTGSCVLLLFVYT